MSQNEFVQFIRKNGGSIMKDIKVLGIDLAKNVFQLHGTNAHGKRILKKRLTWNLINGELLVREDVLSSAFTVQVIKIFAIEPLKML